MSAADPRPAAAGDAATTEALTASVRELSSLVADLSARLELLEERLDAVSTRPAGAGEDAESEALSPEVVLAISAAVAAYLGKRATVKQVRLRRGGSWGAQGRAAIQTSHAIPHSSPHAR